MHPLQTQYRALSDAMIACHYRIAAYRSMVQAAISGGLLACLAMLIGFEIDAPALMHWGLALALGCCAWNLYSRFRLWQQLRHIEALAVQRAEASRELQGLGLPLNP